MNIVALVNGNTWIRVRELNGTMFEFSSVLDILCAAAEQS